MLTLSHLSASVTKVGPFLIIFLPHSVTPACSLWVGCGHPFSECAASTAVCMAHVFMCSRAALRTHVFTVSCTSSSSVVILHCSHTCTHTRYLTQHSPTHAVRVAHSLCSKSRVVRRCTELVLFEVVERVTITLDLCQMAHFLIAHLD